MYICVQMYSFYKSISHTGLGSTLMMLKNYICNDLISKHGQISRYWWLGFQHLNLRGSIQFNQ